MESIPDDPAKWQVDGIGAGRAASLAASLSERREEARLYKELAIVREDVPLTERLNDLRWQGAYPRLRELCQELGDEKIPLRISNWRM
jgi:hypothetical protein